ncbi:MAG: universal stress protein [Deltaproteobacteria bacterium]|nr:universal stress protein [Deltaproteobacteria bacterium]
MLSFKRILYPTDFSSCARQALTQALRFAKEFNSELHVLHAVLLHSQDPYNPAYHFPDPSEILQRLNQLASSEMTRLLEPHLGGALEIHQVLERGIAAGPVILDYAQVNEVDLIVMGSHGRRGPRRFLLGSVAEEVMRAASCPILTLRERPEAEVVAPIRTLVVAVDFSENSKTALALAGELADFYDARLHIVYVLESRRFPDFILPVSEGLVAKAAKLHGMAEERLQEMAEGVLGQKDSFDLHVCLGRAAPEILGFSDQVGADLILMGGQGFSPVEDLFFGSTAEGVVRRALCPVLTIKASPAQGHDGSGYQEGGAA